MITKLETQGKEVFQWNEKLVDISTLEGLLYRSVLALGREIMHWCIEEADKALAQLRGRDEYRPKGCRVTTLKTIMGEVSCRRHAYLLGGKDGRSGVAVYLPDKSMGLDTVGLFSDTVCMMALEAACAVSCRTAVVGRAGVTAHC